MQSLGTPPSSGYYTAGDYYKDNASSSHWGGGAASALGFPEGPVSDIHLQYALEGKNAQGEPVTARAASDLARTNGRDLTHSLPKGVSILAQGPLRKQIMTAAAKANETAMRFVERELAQTRVTDPKTGEQIEVGDQRLVYATFSENTSRENDPGEHFHNVVANLCLGKDGKFRALHNPRIYENRNLSGGIFRAELRSELRKIGLEMETAGKNGLIDVVGVPKSAKDIFSKRRAAILEKAKDSKVPPRDLSQLVTITRPTKTTLPITELQTRWEAELSSLGHSFESLTKQALKAKTTSKITPQSVLKGVVQDLSETKGYWSKLDMLKQAFNGGVPETTWSELESSIKKAVTRGQLILSKDGAAFSTPNIQSQERDVIAKMQTGHLKGTIIEKDASLPSPEFIPTLGQQAAIDHILRSPDRPLGIQGCAGVGKTTLVDIAIAHAKSSGLEIVGIAPTSSAVGELAKIEGFHRTMTTQAFNRAPIGTSKTVLIVDEASMLGTKSAQSILHYANKQKLAKVVFIGDRHQLDSVEAGTPFADMQDRGLHTVVVDDIIRQESSQHREAVHSLAIGRIQKGFKALAPDIHQVPYQDLEARTLDLWHKKQNPKAAIIVQTNRQKVALNAIIKAGLQSSAKSQGTGYVQNIWRPVHTTQREKALTRTYENVSHIRFHKPLKRLGVKGGQVYKVERVDFAKHRITLSKGNRTFTFKPAKYDFGAKTVELYRQETLALDPGDRIRFMRSGKTKSVANNDLGTIKAIHGDTVSIELDKGKTVTLQKTHADLHHIDHGWAITGHAFQGKTVRDAIVLMPSRKSPLTTLKSLYVGISRHKKSIALVTDDAKQLRRNLEKELKVRTEIMPVFEHELFPQREAKPKGRNTVIDQTVIEPVAQKVAELVRVK